MKIISARQPLCRALTKSLSITEAPNMYLFEVGGIKYSLKVPNHYIFDGASIPRISKMVIDLPQHGIMDGVALPHDYGYEHKGIFPYGSYLIFDKYKVSWIVCEVPMSKASLDSLLSALCVHFKACGKFKASLVWSGVAAFGFAAWNSDDVERKDLLRKHEEECHNT
jgi:hypothetical protein